MSAVDNERIAPVTYLFGARKAVEEAVPGSPLSSPAGQAEMTVQAETTSQTETTGQAEIMSPVSRDGQDSVEGGKSGPSFMDLAGPTDAFPAEKSSSSKKRAVEKSRGSFDRISNVSMYALARRGMSTREMRDYLLGREFEASEVDEEIDRLEKVALLDDLALAETLIRTLQARKGLGRSALVAELRRRSIDQLAIESALTELDDDDELERATEIAVKRAGQLRSLDATTAKRRLGDFLMRRGYSGSVVSKAVQQALTPAGPTFR